MKKFFLLSTLQACVDPSTKDELHMVEMEGQDSEGQKIKAALVSLKPSTLPSVSKQHLVNTMYYMPSLRDSLLSLFSIVPHVKGSIWKWARCTGNTSDAVVHVRPIIGGGILWRTKTLICVETLYIKLFTYWSWIQPLCVCLFSIYVYIEWGICKSLQFGTFFHVPLFSGTANVLV